MKYLENEALESLTNFLSDREMGGRMLNGRVEVSEFEIMGHTLSLNARELYSHDSGIFV